MLANTKKFNRFIGVFALMAIMLAACRAPTENKGAATLDLNALYTQVAGTLVAQGQQEAATTAPTSAPLVVTATSSPTSAFPSNTATNSPVPPTNTPAAVCNQAAFIADITIPDGTLMSKGQNFTKTWRLKNSGTCSWTSSYTVVFISGTNLAAKNTYSLPKQVNPGDSVDISIPMQAPNTNGTYQSNWMIQPGSGPSFGVSGSGGGAGVPFFALIKVGASSDGNVHYDFAANYCDATWSSGDSNHLPCPGANSGTKGFVIVLSNPELENRHENEPAIWMQPNHDNRGFLRGVFPSYTVKDKDHFVATIGCLDNNSGCRVQFTLSYIKPSGVEVQLGTWDEKFDGLVKDIDIDLSSLAGKDLQFVLTVEPNNTNYSKDNAFWFVPVIVKE